ncbi:hypothetical protein BVX93_01435 [bacterium B13(2017)]|nr:hypothetical protein BVX93_01435 [bacterium B13(2017)]
MIKKINIACLQYAYKGDIPSTIEFAENEISEASKKGAQLICLPELFCFPYFCQTIDQKYFSYAETIPGTLTQRFQKICKKYKIILILPIFEKVMDGLYYNSSAVINLDGEILGSYRKTHIPDDPCFHEKYYFSPGNSGYKVFETSLGKIAVLICWDQWFPETARIVSLMGADIIVYPTAIGILKGEENFEKKYIDAWATMQRR